MSDILKCPYCGSILEQSSIFNLNSYACTNLTCKGYFMTATRSMWQELIHTRKMLKIAIGAIETIKYSKKSDAINLRHKANKALIDIYKIKDQTALEQKE